MQNSKLFNLLKSLNKKEWKSLNRLYTSIIRNDQRVRLFRYIYQKRENLNNKRFDIENVQKNLFEKLSVKSVQNLISALHLEVLDFLTIEEFRRDKKNYLERQLHFLRRKGLYDMHDSLLKKQKDITKEDVWSPLWSLKIKLDTYFSNHPIKYQNGTVALNEVSDLSNELERNIKSLLNVGFANRYKLWNDPLKSFNLYPKEDLKIFERLCQLYSDLRLSPLAETADLLEYELIENSSALSKRTKLIIVHGLLHYFRREVQGNSNYGIRIQKMNEYLTDHDLILVNERITDQRFLNCIIAAISPINKKVNWATAFHNKFINFVSKDKQEVVSKLGLAFIEYGKDNSWGSIGLLNKIQPYSLYSKILVYRLNIWATIDVYADDWEFILTRVESFEGFLKRNQKQISDFTLEMNLNLCKYIRKWSKAKNLQDLVSEIERNQNISYRYLLIEKIKTSSLRVN